MTSWANNLNGIPTGNAVTTGNSGGTSGTSFAIVAFSSPNSTATATAAAAYEGTNGLQLDYTSTDISGAVLWDNVSGGAGVRVTSSFYVRFANLPTVAENIASLSSFVWVTPSGQLQARIGTGVYATSLAASAGTWLYVEHASTYSTGSTGRIELNVFRASDGATLLAYDSGNTLPGVGGGPLSYAYFGRNNGSASANRISYDLLAMSNVLATGFPGTRPAVAASGHVKVWTGTAWVAKPVKVWTGSAWVTKPVKRWTGTAWVTTTY